MSCVPVPLARLAICSMSIIEGFRFSKPFLESLVFNFYLACMDRGLAYTAHMLHLSGCMDCTERR